jgi:hypothetical protein
VAQKAKCPSRVSNPIRCVELSDFFLFGYLKGEITNFTATPPADILSDIRLIVQKISKETLLVVHDESITQLEWRTENKGEYYHMEEQKSGTC